MSARKRSTRSNRLRKSRSSSHPLLEALEDRLVLSQQVAPVPNPIPGPVSTTGEGPQPPSPLWPAGVAHTLQNIVWEPGAVRKWCPRPDGRARSRHGANPDQGYSPIQLQTAYGINQVQFPGGVLGTGAGQTIAVIDAGNNTGFQPTGAKFHGQ